MEMEMQKTLMKNEGKPLFPCQRSVFLKRKTDLPLKIAQERINWKKVDLEMGFVNIQTSSRPFFFTYWMAKGTKAWTKEPADCIVDREKPQTRGVGHDEEIYLSPSIHKFDNEFIHSGLSAE